MPGPSWLPTRPTWMPAWDEIYKGTVPSLWPKRMVKKGGNLAKDLESMAHGLSWVREALDWLLHAFFPERDDNALFLGRWEEALGIADPPSTTSGRVARIQAAMRQRHTMTEDQIKAIFCRCWTHNDPTHILIAYPSAANVATYSTNELTNLHDQNHMHIYDSTGAGLTYKSLADDLVRRLCPAWQRWSVGEERSLIYGNGSGDTKLKYRWGRAAIGNGP